MAKGAARYHEHLWYRTHSLWKVFGAEMVGTALLGFVIEVLMVQTSPDWLVPLGIGALLLSLCNVFGDLSGAHFNPTITVGVYSLDDRFSLLRMVVYVVGETVGAVAGVQLAFWLCHKFKTPFLVGTHVSDGYSIPNLIVAEALFTCVMNLSCFRCAIATHTPSPNTAVWVAGSVVAASYAGGPVSGACMNPSLAIAYIIVQGSWIDLALYTVGPMCGCALAVFTCILFDPPIWFRRVGLYPEEKKYDTIEGAAGPEMQPLRNSRERLNAHAVYVAH